IVLAKLGRFDWEVEQRQKIGASYSAKISSLLSSAGERRWGNGVTTPHIEPHNTSVYAQYTIQADDRDTLIQCLNDAGIPTAVHYPLPLHLQPAFAGNGDEAGKFPIAEYVAKRVISLPMHADLSQTDQQRVVAALLSARDNL
ncbi:MAG: DegT/DnrJ/EryC1/StrS family aminotransferase, partial [Proteobacteria bacterium]|nr:DegT/DnrJ/EryC1/StrS family aminotransferase [Pseudomonadota bacterium]